MGTSDPHVAYSEVSDELEAAWDAQESDEFRTALVKLTHLAETGSVEAAEAVAEILALPGPHRDPEAAYRWYYIALSQQGYSVRFLDENHDPPYYCGPVGDFRNQSMVSELVTELGFERTGQLDFEVEGWIREHGVYDEPETQVQV